MSYCGKMKMIKPQEKKKVLIAMYCSLLESA